MKEQTSAERLSEILSWKYIDESEKLYRLLEEPYDKNQHLKINKQLKKVAILESKLEVLESHLNRSNSNKPLEKKKSNLSELGVSNITKSIINDLVESDLKGIEEYGVNVDREDYDLGDWLKETYQEMLDSTKYLQASIKLYESKKTV